MNEQEAIKTIKEAMYFVDGLGARVISLKMAEALAALKTCTVEQAKDAWCGRCRAMEPVLDHLFNTFAAGYFGEELRHAISNVWRKWETWDKEADE